MDLASNYWLNIAVREIIEKYPQGDMVVSSGISPSASYHIGHFREILTADALAWGLRQAGRTVVHKHVVDNFDPLRKRYDFLPEEYEKYVGQPISLTPDPFDDCRDEHKTYAEHFYREFEKYAQAMGVGGTGFEVVRSYEDLYHSGKMAVQIEKVIAKSDRIREVFQQVSNRDLPKDWLPLQLLGPNKSFNELRFKLIDTKNQRIIGVDEAGKEHSLDYTKGEVKLNWRLDWPARWQVLGVQVEPFSAQEHGAAGGSYDTGVLFSKEVFGYEPPMPGVRYANVHLVGDTKKMSSSKGNLITPEQALGIMPPEILRYFVVRSKPDRTLFFDFGIGLYNLIDEYSKIQEAVGEGAKPEFYDAWAFAANAASGKQSKVISSIPFNHLVAVYQAGQGKVDVVMEILGRTGYEKAVAEEADVIKHELTYVKNWLAKYAPDSIKFEVQEKLPEVELSEPEKQFLGKLGETLDAETDLDAQGIHDAIYAASQVAGIKASEAFRTLYRVILDKDSGPKAGWFLASLDHDWLVKRLKLEA